VIYAIIKNNYVIDRILADKPITYPLPHDSQVHDPLGYSAIGDWYEESEGLFYRPVNGTPPDYPNG
jgi:hypothetical protein